MHKILKPGIMPTLRSKFRGSLLGSLLGDCLGAPFEGDVETSCVIQNYFDTLEKPDLKGPIRRYTDDTAMMKSVAQSLVDSPEINYQHMAKLFTKEYFTEPDRGYGPSVGEVFDKLRKNKCQDIYQPAREQFGGRGSFGNGGAMRIAPIALYFHHNEQLLVEAARKSTEITHSHPLGVNGAILQCLAVQKALHSERIQPIQFCEELIVRMKAIEKDDDDLGLKVQQFYVDKLSAVKVFLETKYHDELDDDVIGNLGHSIVALDSVPTAVYCFLRALQNDIPTVKTDNLFRRTIQYAITLGGDTDTIACMAGAIAGAYLGEEEINGNLIRQCEYHKEIIDLADKLYSAVDK